MILLRYRFNPPVEIGRTKPTPSGKVYRIGWNDPPEIEVDDADVEFMLAFRGYCCTGGKQPMFELADPHPTAQAANAMNAFSAAAEGARERIEGKKEAPDV